MTVTRQQFAGLLSGLGSSYASSGGYAGQRSLLTIGAILEALADEILENPTETCEVPPARTESGALPRCCGEGSCTPR